MHELSWKHNYEIGHPFIDKEHKHLFEIALEAFKPVVPEQRKQKIRDTVIELNEYMKIHFAHEESFMRLIEFPTINEHINIHNIIIENMKTMLSTLPNKNIKEFEKDLAFFIDSSLVSHILDEDLKIQEWYQNKKTQKHIVRWSPKYLIGEDQIDKEHQELFDIANQAFAISEKSNPNKEEVKNIIHKLATYIKKHFEYEETFMQNIQYPEYDKHCKIHKNIIDEMNILIKESSKIDIVIFELKLAMFIEKHLVQHIIHEDKKIQSTINPDDIDIINLEDV